MEGEEMAAVVGGGGGISPVPLAEFVSSLFDDDFLPGTEICLSPATEDLLEFADDGEGEFSFFTIPSVLSPSGLFSPQGTFGISHNQSPAERVSSSSPPNPFSRRRKRKDFSQRSIQVEKPGDDSYNWRKYGQKPIKGCEFPRSYYKCTQSNCPVKKKVERSSDGQITQIIYKGQHNHEKPQKRRGCGRNAEAVNCVSRGGIRGVVECSSESEEGSNGQIKEENDEDEDCDEEEEEEEDNGANKMRKIHGETRASSSMSHMTMTEPKIIVQTKSEVDLLDDGYKWRKYGQKAVKGSPHPRSYYRCTTAGCTVRKQIERASSDPNAVVTTYEGKHNHDIPDAQNSGYKTRNAALSQNLCLLNDVSFGIGVPESVLIMLKEEKISV